MRRTTTGVHAKKKKKNEAALVFFDGVSIYMYMHRLIQSVTRGGGGGGMYLYTFERKEDGVLKDGRERGREGEM
jgi:hypothetical protein